MSKLVPYYENNRVRLFCGDSRVIVNQLKEEGETFDLLLTDPPYGLDQAGSGKTSGINAERGKGMYEEGVFNDTDEYLHDIVRPVLDSCLSICTLGIVTGGNMCYKVYPEPVAYGTMYCPSSPGFNSWGHQDCWPIWYYGHPHGNTGKYRKLSHEVNERGFCKDHPCSKPLTFWKKLMLCGTDGVEGKTILDPFGGSGTTGRAAQDLGMKATLIELNKNYCDLIVRNCCQETLL